MFNIIKRLHNLNLQFDYLLTRVSSLFFEFVQSISDFIKRRAIDSFIRCHGWDNLIRLQLQRNSVDTHFSARNSQNYKIPNGVGNDVKSLSV